MAYNQPTAVAVTSDMHSHTGVSQNQIMNDNKYKWDNLYINAILESSMITAYLTPWGASAFT